MGTSNYNDEFKRNRAGSTDGSGRIPAAATRLRAIFRPSTTKAAPANLTVIYKGDNMTT